MVNKNILCIDDDKTVRDVITMGLERAGYNIVCTGDPDDAYQVFCDMEPFLTIVDLVISSKTNGVTLARRMRDYMPRSIFIALTGYISSFDFGAVRATFDHVLFKPANLHKLISIVDYRFAEVLEWESVLR
jgi:CheY-like chemotaxis protein